MLEIPQTLVLRYYSPKLKQHPCRDVVKEDCAALPDLVEKMAQLCREYNGAGLAAPQVGIFIRLAVVQKDDESFLTLINPEILSFGGKDLLENEGCLSLPPSDTNQARVWRSEIIRVAVGTLKNPRPQEDIFNTYKGWEARVIQHEVDHLNPQGGIFFIDRVGPVAKQLVLRKFDQYLKNKSCGSKVEASV